MKIIAARNLPSLQKAMIDVTKTKSTNIPPVTFINSKIPKLIQNQGFNKKLSINENALNIMTSTNTFLVHCHTLKSLPLIKKKQEYFVSLNHHVCLD